MNEKEEIMSETEKEEVQQKQAEDETKDNVMLDSSSIRANNEDYKSTTAAPAAITSQYNEWTEIISIVPSPPTEEEGQEQEGVAPTTTYGEETLQTEEVAPTPQEQDLDPVFVAAAEEEDEYDDTFVEKIDVSSKRSFRCFCILLCCGIILCAILIPALILGVKRSDSDASVAYPTAPPSTVSPSEVTSNIPSVEIFPSTMLPSSSDDPTPLSSPQPTNRFPTVPTSPAPQQPTSFPIFFPTVPQPTMIPTFPIAFPSLPFPTELPSESYTFQPTTESSIPLPTSEPSTDIPTTTFKPSTQTPSSEEPTIIDNIIIPSELPSTMPSTLVQTSTSNQKWNKVKAAMSSMIAAVPIVLGVLAFMIRFWYERAKRKVQKEQDEWKTVQSLSGSTSGEGFGTSVCSNHDASIFAVGAPLSNQSKGKVEIYNDQGQLLCSVSGDTDGQRLGQSVAMSRLVRGNVVACGGMGVVKIVRQKKDGTWDLSTPPIYGDNDFFGWDVAINYPGNTLVIGSPLSNNTGAAMVFRKQPGGDGSWQLVGDVLCGDKDGDYFGFSVSINPEGSVVAVGAPKGKNLKGYVRTYQLEQRRSIKSFYVLRDTWVKIPKDIDGKMDGDNLGTSLSLSSSCRQVVAKVAVSACQWDLESPGYVKVVALLDTLKWSEELTIHGSSPFANFGISLSIDEDGRWLCFGSDSHNSGSFQCNGMVQVYKIVTETNDWHEHQSSYHGSGHQSYLGSSVALAVTEDSKCKLVIGCPCVSTRSSVAAFHKKKRKHSKLSNKSCSSNDSSSEFEKKSNGEVKLICTSLVTTVDAKLEALNNFTSSF